jgi:hypothetical protein
MSKTNTADVSVVPASPGFQLVTYFREPMDEGFGFEWHLRFHPVIAWRVGSDVWPVTTEGMDTCPPFPRIEHEGCSLTALLRPDGTVQEMNYAFEIKPTLAEWVEQTRTKIEGTEYCIDA